MDTKSASRGGECMLGDKTPSKRVVPANTTAWRFSTLRGCGKKDNITRHTITAGHTSERSWQLLESYSEMHKKLFLHSQGPTTRLHFLRGSHDGRERPPQSQREPGADGHKYVLSESTPPFPHPSHPSSFPLHLSLLSRDPSAKNTHGLLTPPGRHPPLSPSPFRSLPA